MKILRFPPTYMWDRPWVYFAGLFVCLWALKGTKTPEGWISLGDMVMNGMAIFQWITIKSLPTYSRGHTTPYGRNAIQILIPWVPALTLKQTRMSHARGDKNSGHLLGSKAAQSFKIKRAAGPADESKWLTKLFGSVLGDGISPQE